MAGNTSNYLEDKLINIILRNTAWTPPNPVYLALYESDPTDADAGTEATYTSYARQSIAFDAPSGGVTQNTSAVIFPKATGGSSTITHWGLRDALTSGNLLFYGSFSSSKTYTTNDQPVVDAGILTLTFT